MQIKHVVVVVVVSPSLSLSFSPFPSFLPPCLPPSLSLSFSPFPSFLPPCLPPSLFPSLPSFLPPFLLLESHLFTGYTVKLLFFMIKLNFKHNYSTHNNLSSGICTPYSILFFFLSSFLKQCVFFTVSLGNHQEGSCTWAFERSYSRVLW